MKKRTLRILATVVTLMMVFGIAAACAEPEAPPPADPPPPIEEVTPTEDEPPVEEVPPAQEPSADETPAPEAEAEAEAEAEPPEEQENWQIDMLSAHPWSSTLEEFLNDIPEFEPSAELEQYGGSGWFLARVSLLDLDQDNIPEVEVTYSHDAPVSNGGFVRVYRLIDGAYHEIATFEISIFENLYRDTQNNRLVSFIDYVHWGGFVVFYVDLVDDSIILERSQTSEMDWERLAEIIDMVARWDGDLQQWVGNDTALVPEISDVPLVRVEPYTFVQIDPWE